MVLSYIRLFLMLLSRNGHEEFAVQAKFGSSKLQSISRGSLTIYKTMHSEYIRFIVCLYTGGHSDVMGVSVPGKSGPGGKQ